MKIEVCKGQVGLALYVDDTRVAGARHNGMMQTVLSATVLDKVQEMRLCEQSRVFLKPDTNYRFTVDPSCRSCREAAERAGLTCAPVETQTPKEELRDIEMALAEWLTDNTENVFEDEPEVDGARNLILERLGDL